MVEGNGGEGMKLSDEQLNRLEHAYFRTGSLEESPLAKDTTAAVAEIRESRERVRVLEEVIRKSRLVWSYNAEHAEEWDMLECMERALKEQP